MIKIADYLLIRDALAEAKAYLEHQRVSSYDDPHLSTINSDLRAKIEKAQRTQETLLEEHVRLTD